MIALTLTAPLAYEANPGIVQGVAPGGTTALRVLADGHSVRLVRLTSGRRAFLVGPIGLPPRDLTVTVEALDGDRVLARANVDHVFGLPAAAANVAPAHSIDAPLQRRVAALPARTGATSAAWIRNLADGSSAAYNAGARFPAVGHKAGWLSDMQHDAALVFTPHGTIVAVFMNYAPGGVSYTRVRDADGDAVRLALHS